MLLYRFGRLLWAPLIIHLVVDIVVFALVFKYNFQNAYTSYNWTIEKNMSVILSNVFFNEGWGMLTGLLPVSTLWYFVCTIVTVKIRHLLSKRENKLN